MLSQPPSAKRRFRFLRKIAVLFQRVSPSVWKQRLHFDPQIAAESAEVSVGDFGTDSLPDLHRRTIECRCVLQIGLSENSELGDDAALRLPIRRQRILAEPLGGQADWLITLHD